MAETCTCDPLLEYGPNDPRCPAHGSELRAWESWLRGDGRCPLCTGLSQRDFMATCDCWQADREVAAN